jgi:hypothetical protein
MQSRQQRVQPYWPKYVLCKKEFLKTLFTIGREKNEGDTLLIEIGQDHCCFGYLDEAGKAFSHVGYIAFDDLEIESRLPEILSGLKEGQDGKIVICSVFEQALLIPQQYFNPSYSLPAVMYDQPDQKQLHDLVAEWQVIAAYFLPRTIYENLLSTFPTPLFFHAYTPALKTGGSVEAGSIDIHFSTRYFRVFVKQEGQLHLAQIYAYKTPLDVVYYLLKICTEFQLNQAGAQLVVSGLIDKDSAMYEELHNYFLNIRFASPGGFSIPENSHPHYYFTSLYNLAACVS